MYNSNGYRRLVVGKRQKKNYIGQYCKICGEIKANEKFNGKGHRRHIFKSCSKLSVEKRNELVRMRKIVDIELSEFYLSKKDRDLLKKYSKDKSVLKKLVNMRQRYSNMPIQGIRKCRMQKG